MLSHLIPCRALACKTARHGIEGTQPTGPETGGNPGLSGGRHREQDQIGAARPAPSGGGQAGFRAAARVGRTRRSATNVLDEWPSPLPASAGRGYRTRLTGHLTPFSLFAYFPILGVRRCEFLPGICVGPAQCAPDACPHGVQKISFSPKALGKVVKK